MRRKPVDDDDVMASPVIEGLLPWNPWPCKLRWHGGGGCCAELQLSLTSPSRARPQQDVVATGTQVDLPRGSWTIEYKAVCVKNPRRISATVRKDIVVAGGRAGETFMTACRSCSFVLANLLAYILWVVSAWLQKFRLPTLPC